MLRDPSSLEDEFKLRFQSGKKVVPKEVKDQFTRLHLLIFQLGHFSSRLQQDVQAMDWHAKRDLIRSVVKQIDIDHATVSITFRVRDTVEAKTAYCELAPAVPHVSFNRSASPARSNRGESPHR